MTIKKRIYSPQVTEPAEGMWSNALLVDQMLFISGLTARGKNLDEVIGKDEYQQAKVVFSKIRDLVESAGGVMDDIVKMTIFVTHISENKLVWQARREFFSGDFPACTLVEVKGLARPDILLEIEATAIVGCSG
ncbi:RidA family protein [Limnobaculum xujianqingii]|uniref:RidA family protein n=1 Tax=Limnobaculum xujianqingii TaxID=2738837 RepID=UPI00112D10E2|nr:RidA family protein [Limnobaculum xujianqingii]